MGIILEHENILMHATVASLHIMTAPPPQWGQTINVVQFIFRDLNILQLFLENKWVLVIEWTLKDHNQLH